MFFFPPFFSCSKISIKEKFKVNVAWKLLISRKLYAPDKNKKIMCYICVGERGRGMWKSQWLRSMAAFFFVHSIKHNDSNFHCKVKVIILWLLQRESERNHSKMSKVFYGSCGRKFSLFFCASSKSFICSPFCKAIIALFTIRRLFAQS